MATPTTIGTRLARKVFDSRSRAGRRNAEVHLSEAELAALFKIAAELGSAVVTSADAAAEVLRIDAALEPLGVIASRRFELDGIDVGPARRWALDNELHEEDLRAIAALKVGQALNLGGGAGATMTVRRTL